MRDNFEITSPQAEALRQDKLHLILMPTEKCNFRCTYCYERFDTGRMRPEIVNAVKLFLMRRMPSLNKLHIGWFGGEPTLCADIIEDVNDFAICNNVNNAAVSSSISTNAWLLDFRLFSRLIACGLNAFQISIDGAEVDHNKTRITSKGVGSFGRIFENIKKILNHEADFIVAIRIHIHDKNINGIRDLISKIVFDLKQDKRVKVYIKPVERLGGNNDEGFPFLSNHNDVDALIEYAREYGIYEERAAPDLCYAAAANSLIIRADGRIAKCTVAFNDNRNAIGYLKDDGTIQVENDRWLPWVRGALSGDAKELACPLHGLPGLEGRKVIEISSKLP